jgi:hypothetical protein
MLVGREEGRPHKHAHRGNTTLPSCLDQRRLILQAQSRDGNVGTHSSGNPWCVGSYSDVRIRVPNDYEQSVKASMKYSKGIENNAIESFQPKIAKHKLKLILWKYKAHISKLKISYRFLSADKLTF